MARPKMTVEQAIASLAARIEALTDPPDENGCRLFRGYRNPTSGYGQVAIPLVLRDAGWPRTATAPRSMCFLVHGQPSPDADQVLHSCNVAACCNPDHLRWGSHAENMQDRVLAGRQNTGVLAAEDVREIRRAWAADPPGRGQMLAWYAATAARYGVTDRTIRAILSRSIWAWLPD